MELLFEEHYKKLARLLYRITGDTESAEEAASEAFVRLDRNPPASDDNVAGWLYRTGLRLALDHARKARRRARYEGLAAVFGFGASPHELLERDQEASRVRRALNALKPHQISLIVLRSDGLSYAEIAEALHLKPASVGTLLARAQEAFRKEYVNRYGHPKTN